MLILGEANVTCPDQLVTYPLISLIPDMHACKNTGKRFPVTFKAMHVEIQL